MGLSFYHEDVPYIMAAVVWGIGLAGLMTHIILYTKQD